MFTDVIILFTIVTEIAVTFVTLDRAKLKSYIHIKEERIRGRYITAEAIEPFLLGRANEIQLTPIGKSVEGRTIYSFSLGHGEQRVLLWSQMHGNESTTTKAILDLLNFLQSASAEASAILRRCTIKIIPILNPDGAAKYTRVNANKIDLNRDAQDLSQPESRVLREVYDEFQPHFCFNLHGQRTLFNVGSTPKPATLSFLAPAKDEERALSESREKAMKLIVAINQKLQSYIPGQVGRYDDGFNPNCVGDTFQMLESPTLLFEAGHYPDDYEREKTREFVFLAILEALNTISQDALHRFAVEDYFRIPENNKLFFDVLIRNVQLLHSEKGNSQSVGINFKEVLRNNTIHFEPEVSKKGALSEYYGHQHFDCQNNRHLEQLKNLGRLYELLL